MYDNVLFLLTQEIPVQIPLHRVTDSANNGSVFPVVMEYFSASSDHAFINGTGADEPTGILHNTDGAETALAVETLTYDDVMENHILYTVGNWSLRINFQRAKKPCLSLRELEKQVNTDLDMLVNIVDGQMTVCELVDRYLKTKTGVRQSTKQGYVTVQRLLAKETFGKKTIRSVKTSDAKLFLIKLQQEDGKSYSSIHTSGECCDQPFRWRWMMTFW